LKEVLTMQNCRFCAPLSPEQTIALENEHCIFLSQLPSETVLIGSGLIIPRQHRENVFDLTEAEWNATYTLLQQVKILLDEQYAPDGYNVGWNTGRVGGQEIFHAHLHIIPRYKDEPYAGRGIRSWIKQEANRRPSLK
jgi:diadenosine tetraphosphate (Ap4A) HIT family hydrolase